MEAVSASGYELCVIVQVSAICIMPHPNIPNALKVNLKMSKWLHMMINFRSSWLQGKRRGDGINAHVQLLIRSFPKL